MPRIFTGPMGFSPLCFEVVQMHDRFIPNKQHSHPACTRKTEKRSVQATKPRLNGMTSKVPSGQETSMELASQGGQTNTPSSQLFASAYDLLPETGNAKGLATTASELGIQLPSSLQPASGPTAGADAPKNKSTQPEGKDGGSGSFSAGDLLGIGAGAGALGIAWGYANPDGRIASGMRRLNFPFLKKPVAGAAEPSTETEAAETSRTGLTAAPEHNVSTQPHDDVNDFAPAEFRSSLNPASSPVSLESGGAKLIGYETEDGSKHLTSAGDHSPITLTSTADGQLLVHDGDDLVAAEDGDKYAGLIARVQKSAGGFSALSDGAAAADDSTGVINDVLKAASEVHGE